MEGRVLRLRYAVELSCYRFASFRKIKCVVSGVRAIGAHHLASAHLSGAVKGFSGQEVTGLGLVTDSLRSKSEETYICGTC